MRTIKKSIDINAPRDRVWDVLFGDEYTKIWYAEFAEGSHAETDWKVGSKAVFTDKKGEGMISRIDANRPNEFLSLEYLGFIMNGKEDYESAGAKSMMGGHETYKLSEKSGHTHLDITSDMGEEYYDSMAKAWDKALMKVKGLAEKKRVN